MDWRLDDNKRNELHDSVRAKSVPVDSHQQCGYPERSVIQQLALVQTCPERGFARPVICTYAYLNGNGVIYITFDMWEIKGLYLSSANGAGASPINWAALSCPSLPTLSPIFIFTPDGGMNPSSATVDNNESWYLIWLNSQGGAFGQGQELAIFGYGRLRFARLDLLQRHNRNDSEMRFGECPQWRSWSRPIGLKANALAPAGVGFEAYKLPRFPYKVCSKWSDNQQYPSFLQLHFRAHLHSF